MTSIQTKAISHPAPGSRVRLTAAFADYLDKKGRARNRTVMGTVLGSVVARKDGGQKVQVEWDGARYSTEALWPYNLEVLT